MITTVKSQSSLQEFWELPETKPTSEFINGEIKQKPLYLEVKIFYPC